MSERSSLGLTSRKGSAKLAPLLFAVLLLAAASLACSIGGSLAGNQSSAATPTKQRRATFTPLPGALTTPLGGSSAVAVRGTLPPGVTIEPGPGMPVASGTAEQAGSPGAAAVTGDTNLVLYATETPTASPTPTEAPATSTPDELTFHEDATAQPTPYVVIQAATIKGRRGPGIDYEPVGEAKKGQELFVLGRTEDGAWLQVCCIANQPVWMLAEQMDAHNDVKVAAVLTPPPVPLPTPTKRPVVAAAPRTNQSPLTAPQPVGTPLPPFDIARGPEFPWAVNNGIMNIWVKVFEGPADNQSPLGGYILKVFRDGVDISKDVQSFGDRPFDNTGKQQGNFDYNLKFELNDASESDYEIYLARPGGFRVSPITKFTTKGPSYRNLVVYIGYWLAR